MGITLTAVLASVLPFHLAFAGPVQVLAPVIDADGRLGQCDVLPGAPPAQGALPWAQLAYNAGARVNRWEFRWDREEPTRGHWDFAGMDTAVQSSAKYGLDVEGILIGTPGWATAPGQSPGNGVPRGLYRSVTDPRNLWADYVRQTVQRYRGQVHSWEIWNEPDLHFFWMGSPDDYFRLLKVAYRAIKDVDPNAVVLMAGMVAPDLQFVARVLDAVNRDPGATTHGGYFDAVSWHAYGPARALYTNIINLEALFASSGYPNVPLWVTEDGFPASNPNGEPRQAAYVVETIAYALAAGASKVLVYRASDDSSGKTWGLVSAAGAPRMAYVAYQLAAQYFSHADSVTYAPTSSLEQLALYRPGQRVRLLWGHGLDDRQLQVEADQPTATLVDWTGATSPLTADNGQFTVSLPGARYNAGIDPAGTVVGGPPEFLVEDNTRPAGAAFRLYAPVATGSNRRMILLNGGDVTVSAVVEPAARPRQHVSVQLPPHSAHAVDLDLLAGPGYAGMFDVSSTGAVAATGVGSGTEEHGMTPSRTWYLPAAPPAVTIGNTTNRSVVASITAVGARGIVRARGTVELPPAGEARWGIPPELAGDSLALVVRVAAPVVVSGVNGSWTAPVALPQTAWYGVHPQGGRVSIFNQSGTTDVRVDVQFVGSRTLTGEQIHLAPRHLYVLRTHKAKALAISASAPVTAAYADDGAAPQPLVAQPAARTGLTLAGPTTHAAVFNPTAQVAHLSLGFVDGTQISRSAMDIPARRVVSIRAPGEMHGPRALLVTSDVPVVAAAVR